MGVSRQLVRRNPLAMQDRKSVLGFEKLKHCFC